MRQTWIRAIQPQIREEDTPARASGMSASSSKSTQCEACGHRAHSVEMCWAESDEEHPAKGGESLRKREPATRRKSGLSTTNHPHTTQQNASRSRELIETKVTTRATKVLRL